MEQIFVFAAGGHTKYTIDIIEQEGKYEIAGILAGNLLKGELFAEYPVLGSFDDLPDLAKTMGINKGVVTIGDNFSRRKVANLLVEKYPELGFISAIHPSAVIGKNTTIGAGTVVMAGVIVNNDCTVGEHVFLATKSSLDHDSQMGDYSSLSPGVTTGGNVSIGTMVAVGLGANILHGMSVGDYSVIGSGSLVTKPIGSHVVAYGVPCKVVRERQENDKYL
jgi:sugar O-acyltransferase (sialic acid O-acetyltransferase NeuD family)